MGLPLTPDIGAPVIDRSSRFWQALLDYVVIEASNPSTRSGKLIRVAYYLDTSVGVAGAVHIGTFFSTGANRFSTRDFQWNVGALVLGYNEWPVDIDIEIGDFIGLRLIRNCPLELDAAGGAGIWYLQTGSINLTNQLFTYSANSIVSLGGIMVMPPTVQTDPATGVT